MSKQKKCSVCGRPVIRDDGSAYYHHVVYHRIGDTDDSGDELTCIDCYDTDLDNERHNGWSEVDEVLPED